MLRNPLLGMVKCPNDRCRKVFTFAVTGSPLEIRNATLAFTLEYINHISDAHPEGFPATWLDRYLAGYSYAPLANHVN